MVSNILQPGFPSGNIFPILSYEVRLRIPPLLRDAITFTIVPCRRD